ncbi:alkaline phosphatase family protein [Formosa sediminum]|uniref:Alkaline phosphatase family protein n=1 Tax=Formosa sediminum TaxID=2594004 RepID=A0A516GSU5_9FLAO|nr:alkaline phosphatase family protein [Formosa sediminum]QDO94597.1 alkaline phosphatase family protein [Formosa sediminum]
MNKKICSLLLLVLMIFSFYSCTSSKTLGSETITTNSKASQKKPYVILVSLDGFRWDYVDLYKPPHLTKFIEHGVKAESLIPAFPSKTFPNHYTIATGMYPDHHGLIGNSFYSYKKEVTYNIRDRALVEDGTFYGGTPIWVNADKNNMVSASYFFVGSEANIQGVKPTYYHIYDSKIKNETRVTEALNWLKLPEQKRPHIITMYFSDMDDVGHRYSPNAHDKLRDKLLKLDDNLGRLFDGVAATGLDVNIIIVSDHGMTAVTPNHYIPTESVTNTNLYTLIDNGAMLDIHPNAGVSVDEIMAYLTPKQDHFKVYKTAETPGFEYTPKNEDWGKVQIIPDFGYYFGKSQRISDMKKAGISAVGVHGYNPIEKDMHGIFYANGPAFKSGFVIPSIQNIHIYPLMCEILDLKVPSEVDGKLEPIQAVLK